MPLQDWREGIELGRKMTIAGARITQMSESGGPEQVPIEIGQENAKGSIGDVHPWLFLQTKDRANRAMGVWTQGFAAIAGTWSTGGYTSAKPMRGWHYQSDERFEPAGPLSPAGLPLRVKGQLGTVWPSMRDDGPSSLWIHGDPRLVCPAANGPFEAATLVCDMQPALELCMDGSTVPGQGGRAARLNSMMRVIAFDHIRGTGGPISAAGNALAWNLTGTADGLFGGGICFSAVSQGAPSATTGGSNPSSGGGTTGQQSSFTESSPSIETGSNSFGSGIFWGSGPNESLSSTTGKAPNEYGSFSEKKENNCAVIFMSNHVFGGPIHGGCSSDKHKFGRDRDGHNMQSAHISSRALYYDTPDRDGPFEYGGEYAKPEPLPLVGKVHLSWDRDATHSWSGATKQGLWRWYAEVPHIVPGDQTPPGTPNTPQTPGGGRGPTTPGGGGGRGPGPGGPGPGRSVPPPTTGRRPRFEPKPPGPTPGGPGQTSGGPAIPGIPGGRGPTPGGRGPTTGGRGPTAPAFPQNPAVPDDPNPYAGVTVGPIDPTPRPQKPLQEPPIRWNEGSGRWEWGRKDPKTGNTDWYDENGNLLDIEVRNSPKIGDLDRDTLKQFSIHHPFVETYSHVGFRPQLTVKGAPNLERNRFAARSILERDEEVRPQVASLRPWGAQVNGDWKYTTPPEASRNRGGVVRGGILLSPPDIEMEDYLLQSDSSRTNDEIENPEGHACLVAAPGTCFGLGLPNEDGGLNSGAVSINQEPSASLFAGGSAPGQGSLRIQQLDSNRDPQTLLNTGIDQGTDEIHFVVGGTQAITIPRGSDTERPATPTGGEIRILSSGSHDVLEMYDAQDGVWQEIGAATLINVKNTSGKALSAGTPVYATGSVGASGDVEVAAADCSNSAKMPSIGMLETDLDDGEFGHAVVVGVIHKLDTSAASINSTVYVAPGGGWTTTKPTATTDLIQNMGRVVRVHASTGEILVMGAGRTNDVPNYSQGKLVGRGSASGSGTLEEITIGSGLSLTGTTLTASGTTTETVEALETIKYLMRTLANRVLLTMMPSTGGYVRLDISPNQVNANVTNLGGYNTANLVQAHHQMAFYALRENISHAALP